MPKRLLQCLRFLIMVCLLAYSEPVLASSCQVNPESAVDVVTAFAFKFLRDEVPRDESALVSPLSLFLSFYELYLNVDSVTKQRLVEFLGLPDDTGCFQESLLKALGPTRDLTGDRKVFVLGAGKDFEWQSPFPELPINGLQTNFLSSERVLVSMPIGLRLSDRN